MKFLKNFLKKITNWSNVYKRSKETAKLEIAGFFGTGTEASPGNYGLKDIAMALRWIQENIGSFGGDRNTVTLWGHGEAASLVHMLALARKTEGLFNRYVTRYKPVPFCSVLFCSSSILEQKLRTWILKKEEHMVSNRYIIQSATALCPMAVNSKTRTRKVALAAAKSFDCLPRKDEENVTTMRTNVTNEEKEREEEEEEEEEEGLDEKQETAMMHCLREVKEIGRFRKVMNYPVRQL